MKRNIGMLGFMGAHWKSTAFVVTMAAGGAGWIAANWDDMAAQRAIDRKVEESKAALESEASRLSLEKMGVEPVLIEENFRGVAEGVYKIRVDMKGEAVECLVNAHGGNYKEVTVEFCR